MTTRPEIAEMKKEIVAMESSFYTTIAEFEHKWGVHLASIEHKHLDDERNNRSPLMKIKRSFIIQNGDY